MCGAQLLEIGEKFRDYSLLEGVGWVVDGEYTRSLLLIGYWPVLWVGGGFSWGVVVSVERRGVCVGVGASCVGYLEGWLAS